MTFRLRLLRLDRFRFLAWAWAMLVVILISAAPDGGAPGSRPIGSPFDPATSAVAVGRQHARTLAMAVADQARPALPFAGAAGLGAAIVLALVPLDFAVSSPIRVAHSHAAGDRRSLTRAHGARAPPAG